MDNGDIHIWEVTLWTNIGTWQNPIMAWVTSKRFYRGEKKISDFDLYEIPNLRKDVKFLGTTNESKNEKK